MTDHSGVIVPSVFRDGMFGDRFLGVIPIARSVSVGDTWVILVAIECFTVGSLLTAAMSPAKSGALPWPSLQLHATDDVGTSYRIRGSGGSGTVSDNQVEFGMTPAIPDTATRWKIVLESLAWRYMHSGAGEPATVGPWRVAIDLATELPVQMDRG